ncbi:glutamate receptor ionotropic, delta-2-like isoform X1 [Bradysia coprophila]|uniref:glutamate receptor ionotropic, delta-2-like isoform X1 n=1 Tax=Bradysia coprophila TaxID=38358 RepID=UPI00187D99AC|nr:glutamate receptor ionotropic, delta-2-like isoform X1 [Bradysia coprophila]
MIFCSGKVVTFCIVWCLIRVGFGIQVEMLETLKTVLYRFNAPLKLTITSCWDEETKVKIVRFINSDDGVSPMFQVAFMDRNWNLTETTTDRHQEVIVVELSCAANTVLSMNRQMFNYYKVIVFDGSVNSSSCDKMDGRIQHLLQDSPVLPISQFFIVCKDFGNNNFAVKQVYRLGTLEPLIMEDHATYNRTHYVNAVVLPSALRRRNFHGFLLKASMVLLNNDSLNHLDDYRDLHIDAEAKYSYQLTKHLISFVNATATFSIVPSWGYRNKTSGSWTGMIGELLRNEADIGATGLFFTTERIPVIEYISHSSTASAGFIFLSPKLSYTDNLYILPFDRLLWISLSILVLVLALWLVAAIVLESNKFPQSRARCDISDVPILIFGAICQQGSAVTPHSITGRMIMILSFITLMFLFVSYSANIVALLQSPSNQIKTLPDLYDAKFQFSMTDTVYNRHFFATEAEPFRKKFYEDRLVDKDGKMKFNTLEHGIKKVREGQYAFFSEESGAFKVIGETFMDNEKCGIKTMGFFQMNLNPWNAIQKNSSYKEIFKTGMMRIHEHGLKQRENLRHYFRKPKCSGGGSSFRSASLIDTGPTLLILLYGFAATLTVFVLELIVARTCKVCTRKTIHF